MRLPLLLLVILTLATAAQAETRVFIIANQPDGYGVDRCLATGASCGVPAARSYCQSRDFKSAADFRKVDPDEVTGSVPTPDIASCIQGHCGAYIAITCQR